MIVSACRRISSLSSLASLKYRHNLRISVPPVHDFAEQRVNLPAALRYTVRAALRLGAADISRLLHRQRRNLDHVVRFHDRGHPKLLAAGDVLLADGGDGSPHRRGNP